MVYLEQQSSYLKKFEGSPVSSVLSEILNDPIGDFSDAVHNATDLTLNLLISLKISDKSEAEKYYAMFNRRQPTKESHWIYDNYVLFSLACVVRKYSLDQQWLRDVIDMSYPAADLINKKIKDTIKNILSGNYSVKGDYHQISVVYQFLAKDEHYGDEAMNNMLSHLWLKPFPFFEDDFLNIMSIKAIEVALLKKSSLTDLQVYHQRHFPQIYNDRANKIAKCTAKIFILAVIIIVFIALWKINGHESKYPYVVKLIGFFGSFSGVGVLAFWGWKSNLAKLVRRLIDKILGYCPPQT